MFKFDMMPWEYASLSRDKKIALQAMVLYRIEQEKKEKAKLKK